MPWYLYDPELKYRVSSVEEELSGLNGLWRKGLLVRYAPNGQPVPLERPKNYPPPEAFVPIRGKPKPPPPPEAVQVRELEATLTANIFRQDVSKRYDLHFLGYDIDKPMRLPSKIAWIGKPYKIEPEPDSA